MKKIIATIIRVIMPNMIRQHEREERNKRIHNANVLQGLLNAHQFIPSTTKKAVLMANKYGISRYNSVKALKEADFR